MLYWKTLQFNRLITKNSNLKNYVTNTVDLFCETSVGKSTIALNLSYSFAKNMNTILTDIDDFYVALY